MASATRISLILLPALIAVAGVILVYMEWLPSWSSIAGETHDYGMPKTFVLSRDPCIVYIKDFITPQEASHLVELAEPRFKPSTLYTDSGKVHRDSAYRSSLTAKLPQANALITRLEVRARSFPFYKQLGSFQPLVVQNYGIAGQYRDHYDWYGDSAEVGGNIASTFFVYIYANCTGGGTNFPRLSPSSLIPEQGKKETEIWDWCDFIDCDRPLDEGVTFKPILGNAVYWENLGADGKGLATTLHAGMPVTSGNKMGLNMWTWVSV